MFVNGLRDDSCVRVASASSDGALSFFSSGSCNVFNYLDDHRLIKTLLTLDAQRDTRLRKPRSEVIIFNQISEPDTHQLALKKLFGLQQMTPQNRWLNTPRSVLETGRDQIAKKLKNIPGLIMPQTVRAKLSGVEDLWREMKLAGLQFPVIIRECGTHAGQRMILLKSSQDLSPLYPLALDGRPFYLTEYYDYCEDGIFTKYRLVLVNGQVFLRSIDSGAGWMVHYQDHLDLKEQDPAFEQREHDLLNHFETHLKALVQPVMTQIYQALKLDYFGVDCHINQRGEILIFEANANMNILQDDPTPALRELWNDHNEAIKEALVQMILK